MFISFRYSWQKSRPVRLERGGVYFLEVLMKEDVGGDHLSVAVRKPRKRRPTIIPQRDVYVKPPGMTRHVVCKPFIFVFLYIHEDYVWHKSRISRYLSDSVQL